MKFKFTTHKFYINILPTISILFMNHYLEEDNNIYNLITFSFLWWGLSIYYKVGIK